MSTLSCVRLHEDAVLPERKSAHAAGYDLHWCASMESEIKLKVLGPWSIVKMATGLAMSIPEGHYGRIAPRSGLALKGVSVEAGVIDSDYRGHVEIVLSTHETSVVVNHGDRIAQLIIERISTPEVVEVKNVDELSRTDRDKNGFGSTGLSRATSQSKSV